MRETDQREQIRKQQQRIINAYNDFVMFMRDFCVPDDKILVPPEGGWPQIRDEYFVALHKDEHVVNVLKHLCYIDSRDTEIIPQSTLVNWASHRYSGALNLEQAENIKMATELESWQKAVMRGIYPDDSDDEEDESYPTSAIGLTAGGMTGHRLVVDCVYGGIHEQGGSDGHWTYDDLGDDIESVLAELKEKFRNMKQLPTGFGNVEQENEGEEYQLLKSIYAAHGRPDNYRKEGCMEALMKETRIC